MLSCEWNAVEGEDVVVRVHKPLELQGVGSSITICNDDLCRAVLCCVGGGGHLVLQFVGVVIYSESHHCSTRILLLD